MKRALSILVTLALVALVNALMFWLCYKVGFRHGDREARAKELARRMLLMVFFVMLAPPAFGQPTYPNPVMPTNTQAQWYGNMGVPGGVPSTASWAKLYATNFNVKADGITDDYQAWTNISYSLRNSNSGPVAIIMPAGTSVVSQGFQFPYENGAAFFPQFAIIGQGPRISTIVGPSGDNIISIRGNSCIGCAVLPITGTCHQGDTTVTVASGAGADGIVAGALICISQTNDPAFCTTADYDGGAGCTYCGQQGTNCCQQFVRVTGTSGTTGVSFAPPLIYAYNTSPIITVPELCMSNCWVENLTITRRYPTQGGGNANVLLEDCCACGVTNCEISWCDEAAIELQGCFQCNIFGNYIHDAGSTQPGSAYGIWLLNYNSSCLIEDNCFNTLQFDIATEAGGAFNAIDYNYCTNVVVAGDAMLANLTAAIVNHGCHAWFNLYEGNDATCFRGDWAHGSSGMNTLLDNHCQMASYVAPEWYGAVNTDVLNYLSKTSWAGGFVTNQGGFLAFEVDTFNYSNNIIGNIVSTNLQTAATQSGYAMVYTNGNATSVEEDQAMVIRFGFPDPGWSGSVNANGGDAVVGPSTFVSGNWDPVNAGITWSPGFPHAVPPSLLYASMPPWWTPGLAWPPGNPTNGTFGVIPAQLLFQAYQNAPIIVTGGSGGLISVGATANEITLQGHK